MQGITDVAAQQRVALFARGTEETRVDNDSSLQVTFCFVVAVFPAAAAAAAAAAASAAHACVLQLAMQRDLDGVLNVILWTV